MAGEILRTVAVSLIVFFGIPAAFMLAGHLWGRWEFHRKREPYALVELLVGIVVVFGIILGALFLVVFLFG